MRSARPCTRRWPSARRGCSTTWPCGRGCAERPPPAPRSARPILVRPAMLPFLPLAAVVVRRGAAPPRAVRRAGSVAAVIAPWTIRNALVLHGRSCRWPRKAASRSGPAIIRWRPATATWRPTRREARRDRVPRGAPGADAVGARAALLSRRTRRHHRPPGAGGCGLESRKLFYTIVPAGPSYTTTLAEVPAAASRAPPGWCCCRSRWSARGTDDGACARRRRSG